MFIVRWPSRLSPVPETISASLSLPQRAAVARRLKPLYSYGMSVVAGAVHVEDRFAGKVKESQDEAITELP